jgi:hypothetical protein
VDTAALAPNDRERLAGIGQPHAVFLQRPTRPRRRRLIEQFSALAAQQQHDALIGRGAVRRSDRRQTA